MTGFGDRWSPISVRKGAPDGEPGLQAGLGRPAVDRPAEPRPGRGRDRGPHPVRGGGRHIQPPPPAPAPEVRRAVGVRAAGRHRAHLRDVPPRARHRAHPRRARRPPPRPPRPAHPRRRVRRHGPHRTPPAHRRTAVHREVHDADPRRRRRTPARPPTGTDLRRAAGRRGQGQQGWTPPGCHGSEGRRPTPAAHRTLLDRCQPLDGTPGTSAVPAQRKARREYANRVNSLAAHTGR